MHSLSRFTLTETRAVEGHIDANKLHFQCKKSLLSQSLHAKFVRKFRVEDKIIP